MREYFVVANSFAAPFVSDQSTEYWDGISPTDALWAYIKEYKHPCKLFAAEIYESADDWHKHRAPLKKWYSNKAQGKDGDPYDGNFVN